MAFAAPLMSSLIMPSLGAAAHSVYNEFKKPVKNAVIDQVAKSAGMGAKNALEASGSKLAQLVPTAKTSGDGRSLRSCACPPSKTYKRVMCK